MHSAGLTIKCLDLPKKEGGLGRCSTRKWQDGREARSRKECFTQNKRIQKVVAESEHEGDIVHTGWAGRNQGGGRRGPRGDSGGARMGMGAPANAAVLCWKDRAAQGRDSSFCGAAHRQAGTAGMPRGHVSAALQTSKSHLANKNLFGPPSYYYVCPPSPAHPCPVCQAPQLYPAAPIVTLLTTYGQLSGKLAQSTLLNPRNGPQT